MVFCYVPNGVNIGQWLPNETGKDYDLPPTLKALETHRDDFTVLSGLRHPNSPGGHSGADTWLTGANLKSKAGVSYTNSVSVDQVAAEAVGQQTRYPSLEFSDGAGTGPAMHSRTLAFDRNGNPLPAMNRPDHIFKRLFTDNSSNQQAQKKRLWENRSILDSVMNDANALSKQLGTQDKVKLDEYLGSVREIERRLERAESWIDKPKPSVDRNELDPRLGIAKPGDAHDRDFWLRSMLDLIWVALRTDTTRIVTFEWPPEAGGVGGHHALSHHGGDPQMLDGLARIDRQHIRALTHFLDRLKSTEDGNGTLLDKTMTLYGSGMNSGKGGAHSPRNLPLLLAGGRGLGIKTGQHLHTSDEREPFCNVHLTMLHKMGVDAGSFCDSTGTLTGLV